jgi:hypothetical protein
VWKNGDLLTDKKRAAQALAVVKSWAEISLVTMDAPARRVVTEEGKELARLCRTGRLYDIEKWIAAGKSLDIPVDRHKALLRMAVETGFHSLIELIAKHETNQDTKNSALWDAISLKRLDLAEVLIETGAQVTGVPFSEVLLTWDPKIMHFFLERGADPITERPFAVAFGAKVRTAIRTFLDCKRMHPEHAEALQEQANIALRHFCSKGDMKWISLMLWLKADPRSMGPSLEKDYTYDPECYTSAFEQAAYAGNVEVLKKLKPEAGRDNLEALLHSTAVSGRREAIHYLLEIGAKPNDRPNGGSSALESCLWRLSWGRFNGYGEKKLASKYDASDALECIAELLAHGAVWNPGEPNNVTSLRRTLCECEASVTVALLQLFRKYNACPAERVHKLLGTPRIREHLSPEGSNIARLGIRFAVESPGGRLRTGSWKAS